MLHECRLGMEDYRLHMKKYNYIDLVKMITMFLVILCHCLLFFSDNPYWVVNADYESYGAKFLCNILNYSVVPVFVFSAGFLFQVSMQHKESSITDALIKRAKRLLLPYLLYGLLWLVPTYTLFDIPSYGRPEGSSLTDGYKSMLLGMFCDVAWFLLMLFWVSIIWIILKSLLKRNRLIVGSVVAVALYFATHYLLAGISFYTLSQIDIYIVIFFMGASFFWIADKTEKLSMPVLITISVVGILICAILAQYAPIYYWTLCVFEIVMPVVMVLLAMGLCKLKLQTRIEDTRIYKWLLKHNMDIYLMQAPGMYLSFRLFYPLVGQDCALCVILCYILTIALDIFIVLVLSYIRNGLHRLYGAVRRENV